MGLITRAAMLACAFAFARSEQAESLSLLQTRAAIVAKRREKLEERSRESVETDTTPAGKLDEAAAASSALLHGKGEDGSAAASAEAWEALYAELRAISKEREAKGISPPLLMPSESCAGSSVVMRTAKGLISSQSHPVFVAEDEFYKPFKNPYMHSFGEVQGLVEAARDATSQKKVLIFKVKAQWMQKSENIEVHDALVALQPRTAPMLRKNVLDQVVCQVRDCWEQTLGRAVSDTGEKSSTCFARRHTGEHTKAFLDTSALSGELNHRVVHRNLFADRLFREGFGRTTLHFYEELMAYEMDATQVDRSAQAWKDMMSDFGFNFSVTNISSFLKSGAGSYPSQGSHADTIYNIVDVDQALKPDALSYSFLRS